MTKKCIHNRQQKSFFSHLLSPMYAAPQISLYLAPYSFLRSLFSLSRPPLHSALTLPLCVYDTFYLAVSSPASLWPLQPPSSHSHPPEVQRPPCQKGATGHFCIHSFFLVTHREELYTDQNTRHKGILGMKATQLGSVRHV